MGEVTSEQVRESVHEELSNIEVVAVGSKQVAIRPLKRRWQTLFRKAAFEFYKPEMMATDEIRKIIEGGDPLGTKNVAEILVNSETESDANLDRAAAVVLASQVPGAETDTGKAIQEQINWIMDNAETKELQQLVTKQFEKERFMDEVGERWPARLVRFARLAGDSNVTVDSLKQHLTSSLQKSPVTPAGDGGSPG